MDQERRTDFDRFPSFGAVSSGLLPILPFEIPSPFQVGPAGGVVIWLTVGSESPTIRPEFSGWQGFAY